MAGVTNIFTALFAKRQTRQRTAREAYIQMRSELASGKKVTVDEVDIILDAVGVSPEQLQQELERLAKVGELTARKAKYEIEAAKAPEFEAERTRLSLEFESYVHQTRLRLAKIHDDFVMASSKAIQVHHLNEQIAELQIQLDRLPNDPVQTVDLFPGIMTPEQCDQQREESHAALRAERAARPPQPSGRPRPATGDYINFETFDRVSS